MKQSILLVLLLVSYGSTLEVETETETSMFSRSLKELSQFDTSQMTCNTSPQQFSQVNKELLAWGDLVQHQEAIPHDIQTLTQIQEMLLQVQSRRSSTYGTQINMKQISIEREFSLVEMMDFGKAIGKKLQSLKLPQTKSRIGAPQVSAILSQLSLLSSKNHEERDECCERLLRITELLIRQLANCHQQCQQTPVTIIKIRGKIRDVQVVQQGCEGQQVIDPTPYERSVDPVHVVPVETPEEKEEEVEKEIEAEVEKAKCEADADAQADAAVAETAAEKAEITADEARQNAEQVVEAAHEAQEKAEEALRVADEAVEEAKVAEQTAAEAQAVVEAVEGVDEHDEVFEEEATEEILPVAREPEVEHEESIPVPVHDESEEGIPAHDLVVDDIEHVVPQTPIEDQIPEVETVTQPVEPEESEEGYTPESTEEGVQFGEEDSNPTQHDPQIDEEQDQSESSEDVHTHTVDGLNVPDQSQSEEGTYVPDVPDVDLDIDGNVIQPEHQGEHAFGLIAPDEEEGVNVPDEEEGVNVPAPEEEFEEQIYVVVCLTAEDNLVESAAGQVNPVHEQELQGGEAYSFSFWVRWLQNHPTQLTNGMNNEKYFVARLSESAVPGDMGLGDRALALFYGPGGFQFSTYDSVTESGDLFVDLSLGQVDGQWTYVHFSYDGQHTAYAYLYADGEIKSEAITGVHHQVADYLKFVVGGADASGLSSFNGQFQRIQVQVGEEFVVRSIADLTKGALGCNPRPEDDFKQLHQQQVVCHHEFAGLTDTFDATRNLNYQMSSEFAAEYAVSGWFKWSAIEDMHTWHAGFRLTSNSGSVNQNAMVLGDRTLGMYIGGPATSNVMALATYSYIDLNGNGVANSWQAVNYQQEDISEWHFVYFGYSRSQSEAYAMVQFLGRTEELTFEGTHHLLSQSFQLSVGEDSFYPSYSGTIANVVFSIGDGSYVKDNFGEAFGLVPQATDAVPLDCGSTDQVDVEADIVQGLEHRSIRIEEDVPEEDVPEQHRSVTVVETPVVPDVPDVPDVPVVPVVPVPVVPVLDITQGCEETIMITPQNAPDILCALSQYLGEVANGLAPYDGPDLSKVCFCMKFHRDHANPDLLALTQVKQYQEEPIQRLTLKQIIAQKLFGKKNE